MNDAAHVENLSSLTCWKDIAHYLGKGVRTVQRWERELGLPVRRPQGMLHNSPKSPVAADPRDLDLWLQSRWALRANNENVVRSDKNLSQMLETLIQRSRELQQALRTARNEHHELVQQISTAVRTLETTCQKLTISSLDTESIVRPAASQYHLM